MTFFLVSTVHVLHENVEKLESMNESKLKKRCHIFTNLSRRIIFIKARKLGFKFDFVKTIGVRVLRCDEI